MRLRHAGVQAVKWLQTMFDNMEARLAKQIADSQQRIIEALTPPPEPELTAADILTRGKERKQSPIRVQRKPFRESRALAEQALDPTYQAMQQRIRDDKAKQPRSK